MEKFCINPDISLAETLPASFYRNEKVFGASKEHIFEKSWQWLGDTKTIFPDDVNVHPVDLLENFLDEPLILVSDKNDSINCLSNVCTHRGNIVIHQASKTKNLICRYHGRQFNLDGRFKNMPEFDEAKNFPRACDSLHQFKLQEWGPHLFVGLNPVFDFSEVVEKMNERIGFLPLQEFKLDVSRSKDYFINCHWALYCDNYLEGFHIPFVHKDLNKAIDYKQYKTEVYNHVTLQIGYTDDDSNVFELPESHPDFGKNVAAYYYWIFPNMMFNFYPWGLSINVVKPISINRTMVSFVSYIYDESKLDSGAGSILDKVELEDEFVVQGVHKGLKSNYYQAGRFSSTREKGVHHFHMLLAKYINNRIC